MSRDLNELENVFKEKVIKTLAECEEKSYTLKPFNTLRTPQEQAVLWRRSRNIKEINTQIEELKKDKAPWLAKVLEDVGPQKKRRSTTNALPGGSWHQWGLAVDCYYDIYGEADWNADSEGYVIYAHQATINGLSAGRFWPNFRDAVHIQLLEKEITDLYSWEEIDIIMKNKFG